MPPLLIDQFCDLEADLCGGSGYIVLSSMCDKIGAEDDHY